MPPPEQKNSQQEPELTPQIRQRIVLEESLKVYARFKIFPILWTLLLISAAVAIVFGVGVFIAPHRESGAVFAGSLGLALYCVLLLAIMSWQRQSLKLKLATISSSKESAELQERLEENFFTNLVKINFKYIDQYYQQTQLQADKSFVLSSVAACASFVVVVAGILMLFARPETKAAGLVSTASGVLGEFIAAVFFYLYNRTITKMGEYHQKLVLTQSISLALKISEELPPAEQVVARGKLIEYLSKDINLLLAGAVPSNSSHKTANTARRQKKAEANAQK